MLFSSLGVYVSLVPLSTLSSSAATCNKDGSSSNEARQCGNRKHLFGINISCNILVDSPLLELCCHSGSRDGQVCTFNTIVTWVLFTCMSILRRRHMPIYDLWTQTQLLPDPLTHSLMVLLTDSITYEQVHARELIPRFRIYKQHLETYFNIP